MNRTPRTRRSVFKRRSVFVVAEAGVNHNGSERLAHRLIDAAAAAGADAVKFQTFDPEELAGPTAPIAAYQKAGRRRSGTQLDLLRPLRLPPDGLVRLKRHARRRGLVFFSTPFDPGSVALLKRLGVPFFKVGSGDLTDTFLLEAVGRARKPVILSTGMATIDEIARALRTLRRAGARDVALLHAVSLYPTPHALANVRRVRTLERRFNLPTGYSDHTRGVEAALGAVALGACIIEKHLTMDRRLPGPDHRASATPEEFAHLVRSIRHLESALGDGRERPGAAERRMARVARKSLVAASPIRAGQPIRRALLAARRPGTGLSPDKLSMVLGRRARAAIPRGALLRKDFFR